MMLVSTANSPWLIWEAKAGAQLADDAAQLTAVLSTPGSDPDDMGPAIDIRVF